MCNICILLLTWMCKCVTIGAEVVNMTLRELRLSKGLTQKQAAELCSVSLRSYVTFENDESKTDTIKYKYIVSHVMKIYVIYAIMICTKIMK